MSTPYLTLLEALRVNCNLPEFPDPLPSTQMDLELENGPTVTIDFEETSDSVELFCEVGTYQPDQTLKILKEVAQANFLWSSTEGSTLSVRPELRTMYLAQQVPVLSLNGPDFISLVEKFVAVVQQCQKFLAGEIDSIPSKNGEKEAFFNQEDQPPSAMPIVGNSNFIVG